MIVRVCVGEWGGRPQPASTIIRDFIVNMMIDIETRELLGAPVLTSRGFVYVRDSKQLFLKAEEKVVSIVKDNSDDKIVTRVEKSLSKFFYNEIKRRPIVCVLVNEV